MHQVKNNLAPEIISEVFQMKTNSVNLRNSTFVRKNVNTVHYGTDSLTFLGPQIWNKLPNELKDIIESYYTFKTKIKE